jgi:tetratricopeptide (TPR) repeat protein
LALGEVAEIGFRELNKAKPILTDHDAIFVGWDRTNDSLIENLKKLRSIWDNRRILIIGIGDPTEAEKNIAFELGIGSWVNPGTMLNEIPDLGSDIRGYKENYEIFKKLEEKANEALKSEKIDDLKSAMNSLLFIDSRNTIFIEFLGEMLFKNKLYQDAFKVYERVLMNQPNAIRILARAAEALGKLDRHDEAKEYYEKAEDAAKDLLEHIFLAEGKKGYKGGPEALNSALSKLNSPDRVAEYVSNRVESIIATEGEDEAERYLFEAKKSFSLKAVKEIDYNEILRKRTIKPGKGALIFDDDKKKPPKKGGSLDYNEMKIKEKRKNKYKKTS